MDKIGRIVLKEVNIDEFAVNLKISTTTGAPKGTFKDESRRYFEHLQGIAGKNIDLSELTSRDEHVTFIRGIAGMGKSVLAKQLALLWAMNQIYTNFALCIMVECRSINFFLARQSAGLRKHELFSEFLKVMFNYDLGFEKSTLFIIDGIDELCDVKDPDSIIWQLLDVTNSKYAMAKVILTGRPHVENYLARRDKVMGGMRKFEIQGLSEEQIDKYIEMFASCEEDLVTILKTKERSRSNLAALHVPQFLNSFCCVAVLLEGQAIHSVAELYSWTLYLLLKQHVEKEGPNEKRCVEIFKEYAVELALLCKMCYEMLNGNKIIFEGSIQSRLYESGKGKEFLQGLFVDVSDNFVEKYQFKHLILMTFLSAVHICGKKNRMEIIRDSLKQEFNEVVFFVCELIGGCKYEGIIKDMFVDYKELQAIDIQQFLPSILELVGQSIQYEHSGEEQGQQNQVFALSLNIIMCFINRDLTNKHFIISIVKSLHFEVNELYEESMEKVSELCEHLINVFNCDQEDMKETFKNVLVERVLIRDAKSLTFVKYLGNVRSIRLYSIKENTLFIRNEVCGLAKCDEVRLINCELTDDEICALGLTSFKLGSLWINECSLNKSSFLNVCNWVMSSSVKVFRLLGIVCSEMSWWKELADALISAREDKIEMLALRKLDILRCTPIMSKDIQLKVSKFTIYLNVVLDILLV